jgi:hypothetical protein
VSTEEISVLIAAILGVLTITGALLRVGARMGENTAILRQLTKIVEDHELRIRIVEKPGRRR